MAKKKSKSLCKLVSKGKMDQVAKLAKGAKYICLSCGRAAADNANLCKPSRI
ncbi:hypothetical protein ACFL6S_13035 [Candidatus Poribacteria bacterium]